MVSLAHTSAAAAGEDLNRETQSKNASREQTKKKPTLSLKTWIIKILFLASSPHSPTLTPHFPIPPIPTWMMWWWWWWSSYVRDLLGLTLVVDLLLPNRWSPAVLIPCQLIRLVKRGVFIRDRNHTAAMLDFLPTNAHRIPRNPE